MRFTTGRSQGNGCTLPPGRSKGRIARRIALLCGAALIVAAGAGALAHREAPPSAAAIVAPEPTAVPVLATKSDRFDPILDGSLSYNSSPIGFIASTAYGPLMDIDALRGPEPRPIAQNPRLRSAFLQPAAPPVLVVAALPAPPTPTEAAPEEPALVLAEPAPETAAELPSPPTAPDAVVLIPAPVPRPDIEPPAPVRTAVAPPEDTAQGEPQPAPRRVRTTRTAAAPETGGDTDKPSIFQRLFGGQQKSGTALSYASLEKDETPSVRSGASMPNWFSSTPKASAGTAVYDISARTVYMPNGERLEAHSGLGEKRDDPRWVHVKMKGATPPHTYDLSEREALFHGVQALRLTPVGGTEAVHGRVGLLAHTYLLGPRGDSNGCVSFKDYDRFLQAYRKGEIRRLVVVSSR